LLIHVNIRFSAESLYGGVRLRGKIVGSLSSALGACSPDFRKSSEAPGDFAPNVTAAASDLKQSSAQGLSIARDPD
jgi:hypothetical protein